MQGMPQPVKYLRSFLKSTLFRLILIFIMVSIAVLVAANYLHEKSLPILLMQNKYYVNPQASLALPFDLTGAGLQEIKEHFSIQPRVGGELKLKEGRLVFDPVEPLLPNLKFKLSLSPGMLIGNKRLEKELIAYFSVLPAMDLYNVYSGESAYFIAKADSPGNVISILNSQPGSFEAVFYKSNLANLLKQKAGAETSLLWFNKLITWKGMVPENQRIDLLIPKRNPGIYYLLFRRTGEKIWGFHFILTHNVLHTQKDGGGISCRVLNRETKKGMGQTRLLYYGQRAGEKDFKIMARGETNDEGLEIRQFEGEIPSIIVAKSGRDYVIRDLNRTPEP